MAAPPLLRGEGFVLRRWRADDAPDLAAAANHQPIHRWLSGRFPYPYTLEDAHRFLAGEVVDLRDTVLAIEVDGAVAGGIGCHPEQPGRAEFAHSALLGYWLTPAQWGRGVMSRVVGCFAPWVMDQLRLYRLAAHVMPGNHASVGVLRRNGFLEEGTMRSAIVRDGQLQDLWLWARTRDRLAG